MSDLIERFCFSISPGDPLVDGTLLGPVHTSAAVETYSRAVRHLREIGADILTGGERYTEAPFNAGHFVQPVISVPKSSDTSDKIWKTETFAPILSVAVFDELEEAIQMNNAVPQGLSSSLWTRDIRDVGKWIGPAGSDAGIVNVGLFGRQTFGD
jgi:aldehyde dehydrogenase family 7 protein A1